MKINVLHVSTPTTFRGGEQQVLYLINALQDYNIKQVLICPENASILDRVNIEDCKIRTVKKPSSISFSLIEAINQICKKENIHIIHSHDSKAQTSAVLSVLKNKLTAKIIVTRHVLFPVSGYLSKLKYRTNVISKIICVSKAVQKEILKIVPIEKTKVIEAVIDVDKFKTVEKIKFPFFKDSRIKVAYVAALTFEKDHVTFLKTVKLILESYQNITFYIVGEGKLKKDILVLIEKMGLQNNVFLTGFIKNINSLIPQFDYLLFTSKYEGFGTTILDFYLAKKPVITTLCGGNSEFSLHKKTAMISEIEDEKDLANNFILLLNNFNLREKIVENAYNFVLNNYSISILGKNVVKEYKIVLNL